MCFDFRLWIGSLSLDNSHAAAKEMEFWKSMALMVDQSIIYSI